MDNLKTVDEDNLDNELKHIDGYEELKNFPKIVEYINNLQKKLILHKENIKELQNKLENYESQKEKKTVDLVHIEVQTEDENSDNKWIVDNKDSGVSIADQVAETAETAMLQTGYVYEKTTGLYYHYNSGYYYDAKSGLYYDGNTGTYYSFDQNTNSYQFHSQINRDTNDSNTDENSLRKEKKHKGQLKKRKLLDDEENLSETNEPEEGECSESENSEFSEEKNSSSNESDVENKKDYAKTYPPCIRMIVKDTDLLKIKVGTLFIVTYTGGSIGREGDHCVTIPDINVSKHHAKMQYNETKMVYEIIDLGSRNGTFLNGKRISAAKQESEPCEIVHGYLLQLGSTKLLCHIHPGYETCDNCEPGLVQQDVVNVEHLTPIQERHKSELKRLKTKFGIKNDNLEKASRVAEGYQDRAQTRRDKLGSSDPHAKTEQSSLDSSISKSNKGFKMLSKMGWSEGQSLGKDGDGVIEPISLANTSGKSGFGDHSNTKMDIEIDKKTEKKQSIWKKTQKRYSSILQDE